MRNGTRTAALPALLLLLLASCYLPRYIYAPHDVNLPLLKGKNDLQAAALFAGDGAEVHAAYAPASHLGLMLNAGFRNPLDHEQTFPACRYCAPFFDTSFVRYHRTFLDAGAGYFNRFPFSHRLGYALYAGGGPGAFSIGEHGTYRDTALPYSRRLRVRSADLFVQPALSLRVGWVDVALVYRLLWIRYSHDRSTYTPEEETFYHLGVLRRRWLYFTEPALLVRVHDPALPWLMLELQGVASMSRSEIDFDYRPATAGIGLVVDFSRLGKGRTSGRKPEAP